MSDTNFNVVVQRLRRLDFSDDTQEWINTALSDDEISLPKEDMTDELDEDLADFANESGTLEAEEKWEDLGLEKFTKENNNDSNCNNEQ